MKKISILGATGSIGSTTLSIISKKKFLILYYYLQIKIIVKLLIK